MSNDLGFYQKQITNIFSEPNSSKEWESYKLSDKQIKFYLDNGYIYNVKILNKNQLEILRNQLNEMLDPDHSGREYFYEYHINEATDKNQILFHALGAWRVRKAFHDLLWNPAFLVPAYQLLGSSVRFFHDQIFYKPASNGSVVSWHQDFSYWTWTKPMSHLSCWIGLDKSEKENGCLYYIPKSHKWGLLKKLGLSVKMDSIKSFLNEKQIKEFKNKTPVEMEAGYASFHHPLLMHGSYKNKSKNVRRATVINVFSDGTLSNQDINGLNNPGTNNYPQIKKGFKMNGTYYPLLFSPEKKINNNFIKLNTIHKY